MVKEAPKGVWDYYFIYSLMLLITIFWVLDT